MLNLNGKKKLSQKETGLRMIDRYHRYLEIIDYKLKHMFEEQAPFIKCKIGCAYCCKEGEYPMSELEFVNLMLYYNTLDGNLRGAINENISDLLASNRQKLYECPFLIKGVCSVYQARPIICRTFGLICIRENKPNAIPFCIDLGLNYANAADTGTHTLVRCAEDGTEPVAYNVGRKFLRGKEMEETFNIFFGEDKSMVDWLREEF